MTRLRQVRRPALILILCAFAAYAAANLMHNRLGLDPAIVPAALFVGLLLWRRQRGFLLAAAFAMVVPAFLFLRWSELISPSSAPYFFNHVALLAAGGLALAAAIIALVPSRPALQR
jgi:hypothetical protein